MWLLPAREVIVFDLETTRLGEIIEVGAVRINSAWEVIDTYTSLVKPDNLEGIDETITNITGLREKDVAKEKPWARVSKDFAVFTGFAERRLVCWGEDHATLRANYARCYLPYPHNRLALDALSMCFAMVGYLGLNLNSWGLSKVCAALDVPRGKYHRALPDAECVVKVGQTLSELCNQR